MLARPKNPRAESHRKVYISAGGVSIESLFQYEMSLKSGNVVEVDSNMK
jgi:hypothetical protein